MAVGILVQNDGNAVLLVHMAKGVDFVGVGEQVIHELVRIAG
jgi:hypothetical protein